MFDYSFLHWTGFLTAAFLLNAAPGPDFAFILAQTMRGGRRAGFTAMFGIWTGAFIHVLMAAFGLSAVLASSAAAFTAVKWAGAAYLLWLGFQALRPGRAPEAAETAAAPLPLPRGSVFRQGMLVNLLNPKVAVFFLAFLPQFVVPGAGPAPLQLMLHGLIVIAMAAFIEPLLVLAAEGASARLRASRRLGRWLEKGLGAVFVALGVRLFLLER